ncbi:hypothetical protein MKEN_00385500 [Mycena kentingensis (nom. inval.)]|nr:hypothetical protein MKEN_00385500 [Mycena kentingensis (nom. inval.)]
MPPAPKSPGSKKNGSNNSNGSSGVGTGGIAKPKGAVRAKSGCYTCRIRRKVCMCKCDERPNIDGHCETCVRLRLQCLGFGAKRPEWLRENRTVVEMRDRIKAFLAAQGMIKGHAGTGPRGAEQDLPILRLDEPRAEDSATPSSSESPPTPTLSLTSSPGEQPRTLALTSAMRDQRTWYTDMATIHRPHSPFDTTGSAHSHSSHHDPHAHGLASMYPQQPTLLMVGRARASSFGPHYTTAFGGEFDDIDIDEDGMYFMPVPDDAHGILSDTALNMPLPHIFGFGATNNLLRAADEWVAYYVRNTMNLQYMLADPLHIHAVVVPSVNRAGTARDAARLLAAVHAKRSEATGSVLAALALDDPQHAALLEVLKKAEGRYDEGDALAAISMVSAFLFDGGAGGWHKWLRVAFDYASSVLAGADDAREALGRCTDSTRFVVKTAIWFDVLAAVTTGERPWFLGLVRRLFSPLESGVTVYDPASPLDPELSMMSIMGCANVVVWVLAEASALAVWKKEQQARGCLSVPELVERAAVLEKELDAAGPPAMDIDMLDFAVPTPTPTQTQTQTKDRALSAELFRGATRVYLRSIVSGDFPQVKEIAEAVAETMGLVALEEPSPAVVRSTVFAFFVCGALTDDMRTRKVVVEKLSLRSDQAGATVGNSPAIKELLEKIWRERRKNEGVNWRDVLRRSCMLLV